MANTVYDGKEIDLELDVSLTETPDWKLVACLTDSDLDTSRETIDANSKCGNATLAGTATITANFTGFAIKDPDITQVSQQALAEINFQGNGEVRHWRYINNEDAGASYYREFNASLTAYNESHNNAESATFTGTLSVVGDVIIEVPTT
jgi:hypothetical protein